MKEFEYYVAGGYKRSKEKIDVINPYNEEVFARIFETSEEDLETAVFAAKEAQKQWRRVSFSERAKVLRDVGRIILDNLSELAETESREIGKPLKESLFVDVPLAAESFNYYASFIESLEEKTFRSGLGLDIVRNEPFGVCGVYLPFNVPLMIFGFSCAGAVAAGNSLIIKCSEYGSLSLLSLARHIQNLDIPKGLINVVSGRGGSLGRQLAGSDIDMISFTGSRATLKKIFAQTKDNPKKIICELGGCNLSVVFSDSDKEAAMQSILGASFIKQGQMCIGTSVVLVEESSYQGFVKNLVDKAQSIKLGDPFDPAVGMGPVVTKEHLLGVDKKVKDFAAKKGKLLTGGNILKKKGYFYPPTVIETVEMVYDEFFAPVVIVKAFKDREEIEKIITENPTGLVTQIWTQDLDKAADLADMARSGTVWVNTFAQMTPQTPFGGMAQSGWGRNLGKPGFFEYVQPKHIGIGLKKSPVWGWFGV